jgi:hypothetical protein
MCRIASARSSAWIFIVPTGVVAVTVSPDRIANSVFASAAGRAFVEGWLAAGTGTVGGSCSTAQPHIRTSAITTSSCVVAMAESTCLVGTSWVGTAASGVGST